MSEPLLKPGEVFDPVDVTRRLKLYPVDVVDARRDLNDGPKRLYSRLFRIAITADRRKYPWPGYVYASEKSLSERLGKSESRIREDMKALREAGLIKIERPKNQGNNQYSFLWREDFHRLDSSGAQPENEDFHRLDSSGEHRPDSSAGNRVHRPDVSGGHRLDSSGAYKEKQRVLANTEAPVSESAGGFSEFQSAYPEPKQKIKVDSSCRAYVSMIDGKPGEHGRLMAGLERYKASADWQRSLSRDQGRYIPTMEKFIFERRYLDHPPPADEAPDEYRKAPGPAEKVRWDPATEEFIPAEAV